MARPIPAQAARLVPLLGSPVDGEALAAARAIGRVLDRAGLGFVELATAIPTGPAVGGVSAPSTFRAADPTAAPPESGIYTWRRTYTPRQEAEHRARVRFCQARLCRLTPWERGFVTSIDRLRGNLSIRQGDRLAGIVDRLEWEARAC